MAINSISIADHSFVFRQRVHDGQHPAVESACIHDFNDFCHCRAAEPVQGQEGEIYWVVCPCSAGGVDDSVDSYDVKTGIAVLVHLQVGVRVDVSILADDLRFTLGQWIHVMGYLEQPPTNTAEWIVNAIMAWPVTDGFDLVQYEQTVQLRMQP